MKKKNYLVSYTINKGSNDTAKEITLRLDYVSKKYIKGYVDALKAVLPINTQVYCEIIP